MIQVTTISIPKKLADKVKEMIKDTGFSNLSEFTKTIFRELVSEETMKKDSDYTKEIRKKLISLGYLK